MQRQPCLAEPGGAARRCRLGHQKAARRHWLRGQAASPRSPPDIGRRGKKTRDITLRFYALRQESHSGRSSAH